MAEAVRLSRRDIYEQVWSAPMSQLGRQFGISGVGLAKICKRHLIPYPPRGYWAKLRHGHRVHKPSLPSKNELDTGEIVIRSSSFDGLDTATRQRIKERAAMELQEKTPVEVSDTLTNPHPLVERTVRSLNSAKPDATGLVRPKAGRCLNIEVSPGAIDRAARIFDALIRAFEAKGWSVSPTEGELKDTWLNALDVRMNIRIEEAVNRVEKVKSFLSHQHEYELVPSGRLVFRVDHSCSWGQRHKWSDGKRPLEENLRSVITGIVAIAEKSKAIAEEERIRDEKRKEEQRRAQALELRRRREQARRIDFDQKLVAWENAERLRAFIAAVRSSKTSGGMGHVSDEELESWIAWATKVTNKGDPLTTERVESRWPPPTGLKVRTKVKADTWSMPSEEDTEIVPPTAASAQTKSEPASPSEPE